MTLYAKANRLNDMKTKRSCESLWSYYERLVQTNALVMQRSFESVWLNDMERKKIKLY